MTVFLVLAAFGAGFWCSEREAAGKWPFTGKPRDHRQPFRYWRP